MLFLPLFTSHNTRWDCDKCAINLVGKHNFREFENKSISKLGAKSIAYRAAKSVGSEISEHAMTETETETVLVT